MLRTRTPVALNTAFATAAAVGTIAGSPMPAASVELLPRYCSITCTSIRGVSRLPMILDPCASLLRQRRANLLQPILRRQRVGAELFDHALLFAERQGAVEAE